MHIYRLHYGTWLHKGPQNSFDQFVPEKEHTCSVADGDIQMNIALVSMGLHLMIVLVMLLTVVICFLRNSPLNLLITEWLYISTTDFFGSYFQIMKSDNDHW